MTLIMQKDQSVAPLLVDKRRDATLGMASYPGADFRAFKFPPLAHSPIPNINLISAPAPVSPAEPSAPISVYATEFAVTVASNQTQIIMASPTQMDYSPPQPSSPSSSTFSSEMGSEMSLYYRSDSPPPGLISPTRASSVSTLSPGLDILPLVGIDGPGAAVLGGALCAVISEKQDAANNHLACIYRLAASSEKEAQKLVTAGVTPMLIDLLKATAAAGLGIENVLQPLGMLAHDPISANTIFRTGTVDILIELVKTSTSDDIVALCIWVLARLCRSNELVEGLMRRGLVKLLPDPRSRSSSVAQMTSWCLGSLIRTDATAEAFAAQGILESSVEHLKEVAASATALPSDICAAIFAVARLSRSIKLAKALAGAGCIEPLAQYLGASRDASILKFSARAIGCLMRPNSADMSKLLLDAGVANGLARLPQVIDTEDIESLESFAFAIQRFSCAEWGSATRKALVDAGVVDSLLAALRTAADEPYPQTHIELALAVSFLGDVGGAPLRKEIVRAGGIDILKRVGEKGNREVAKACDVAVTSITGNLWARTSASAKTALSHNWSGGCFDYQPPCPPLSAGVQFS